MKHISITYPVLLLLFVTLAACDSNQGSTSSASSTTTTQVATPEPSPPPAPAAAMDHSEHAVDMSGMSQSQQMGGGMAGMDHSQHMEHMANMGGSGMAGMDHSQHMEHMANMSGMDPEQHRQHMAEMGCMNNMDDMGEMAGNHCMDHARHMEHMASMGGMDHGSSTTAADITAPQASAQGVFTASVTSSLDPIIINQIHSWTLHIENTAGEPVDNAVITVDGGMPAHAHGLPTSPEVSEALGNGDYLVEGLMFQMPGHWQITFTITAGDQTDTVVFDFNL